MNVRTDIVNQKNLLSIWEFTKSPGAYIGAWIGVGYSFNHLLCTETKRRLKAFVDRGDLDKPAIYKLCGPKLWRAVVVTCAFFLVIEAPEQFIFPVQSEQISAALQAENQPAQKLYETAVAAAENKSNSISQNVIPIYLQTAAGKGHVLSQAYLGHLYYEGKVVPKDNALSVFWLEKAAGNGNVYALSTLGHFFYDPRYGFPQDKVKALRYLQSAAQAGDANAQVSMGWAYMQGDLDLPVDYGKSAYWNDLGAKQGLSEGMNNLGWLYENGLGVTKDYRMASDLYREASKRGNKEATERLSALLARSPSPQEVDKQKLEITIRELEAKYPELNERSPKYNQKIVDVVLARQRAYIQRGVAAPNALQLAVDDLVRASSVQNNVNF